MLKINVDKNWIFGLLVLFVCSVPLFDMLLVSFGYIDMRECQKYTFQIKNYFVGILTMFGAVHFGAALADKNYGFGYLYGLLPGLIAHIFVIYDVNYMYILYLLVATALVDVICFIGNSTTRWYAYARILFSCLACFSLLTFFKPGEMSPIEHLECETLKFWGIVSGGSCSK